MTEMIKECVKLLRYKIDKPPLVDHLNRCMNQFKILMFEEFKDLEYDLVQHQFYFSGPEYKQAVLDIWAVCKDKQ